MTDASRLVGVDHEHALALAFDAGREDTAKEDTLDVLRLLVRVAHPVWRWGDGHGGWVSLQLWAIAEAAGLDVGLTDEFKPTSRVKALAERDGWICHYCGHPLGIGSPSVVRRPEIEHVMPTSRGGSNRLADLVLACPPCNSQKAARTPLEWLGSPCCDRHPF